MGGGALLLARPGLQRQQRQQRQQAQQLQRRQQRRGRRRAGPGAAGSAVAIAVPGPLFISEGFDRERLEGVKASILPSSFIQFPVRDEVEPKRTPPLVRVRLAVEYRVHSRQMLCVGGSAIPLGWSFLSIAKVPMSWNPGDVWAVEIELPAGSKVEYKYVVLEEQDWTRQVNELAEGKVDYDYRIEPDSAPPDIQRITKQMAIVAWQPGPNRALQVPTEEELNQLRPGDVVHRLPPTAPLPSGTQRSYGQQALGKSLSSSSSGAGAGGPAGAPGGGAPPTLPPLSEGAVPSPQERSGVWETLSLDEEGRPFLDRRDVWGREYSSRSSQRFSSL